MKTREESSFSRLTPLAVAALPLNSAASPPFSTRANKQKYLLENVSFALLSQNLRMVAHIFSAQSSRIDQLTIECD